MKQDRIRCSMYRSLEGAHEVIFRSSRDFTLQSNLFRRFRGTQERGSTLQRLKRLLGGRDQGRPTLPDHPQATGGTRVIDPAGNRHCVPPLLLDGQSCRDQGARSGCGLHHEDRDGQSGDDSIATGEPSRTGWSMDGVFTRDTTARGDDRIEERHMLRRIGNPKTAAEYRGGPPRSLECFTMCRCIDASCASRDDVKAMLPEEAGESSRLPQPVGGGTTRAHDGDDRLLPGPDHGGQGSTNAHDQRWIWNGPEQPWVPRILDSKHQAADPSRGFSLSGDEIEGAGECLPTGAGSCMVTSGSLPDRIRLRLEHAFRGSEDVEQSVDRTCTDTLDEIEGEERIAHLGNGPIDGIIDLVALVRLHRPRS